MIYTLSIAALFAIVLAQECADQDDLVGLLGGSFYWATDCAALIASESYDCGTQIDGIEGTVADYCPETCDACSESFTCTCDNGTESTGEDCTADGESCANCNPGYTLTDGACVAGACDEVSVEYPQMAVDCDGLIVGESCTVSCFPGLGSSSGNSVTVTCEDGSPSIPDLSCEDDVRTGVHLNQNGGVHYYFPNAGASIVPATDDAENALGSLNIENLVARDGIKVGSSTADCGDSTKYQLKYEAGALKFCDGVSWKTVQTA